MKEFLTIAALHLLVAISPGPSFLLIVRNSLFFSRRIAVFTALGIAFGNLVHVFYSIVGIGYLVANSLLMFQILKILGAGYLLYLGILTLLQKTSPNFKKSETCQYFPISRLKAIQVGFLTNILNPKVILFYLSIFSQIISPSTSVTLKMAYGLEMTTVAFIWCCFVAFFCTQNNVQNLLHKFLGIVQKFMGALFAIFGIKLLFISKD